MNRPERTDRTWEQLLAAYADGELDEPDRRRVRGWLLEHPEAMPDLRAQRGLSPANTAFWEAASPDSPNQSQWRRVWNGIEAGIEPRPAVSPAHRSRSRWWKRGLMAAILAAPTTAAAAAVAVMCLPVEPPRMAEVVAEESSEEVFQVASVEDVQILSVREADVPQLVVGEPPFNEAMTLVSSGDVRLEALLPAGDGMVAEVQMGGWVDAPMIYAPMPRTP